jgi:hypothetical protein
MKNTAENFTLAVCPSPSPLKAEKVGKTTFYGSRGAAKSERLLKNPHRKAFDLAYF